VQQSTRAAHSRYTINRPCSTGAEDRIALSAPSGAGEYEQEVWRRFTPTTAPLRPRAPDFREPDGEVVRLALRRERDRIARDLHDGVLQELILSLMGLRRVESPKGMKLDQTPLIQATVSLSRSLNHMRDFLRGLRSRNCESDIPEARVCLTDVLRPIIVLAEANFRVDVQLSRARAVMLGPRAAREIDMILRETVLNAIRHSEARVLSCTTRSDGGRISIEIADDGRGFDPRQTASGFGLLGMAERASILGAALEVRSRRGRGTIVRLRLAKPTITTE